ncbi:laccase domain protein [Tistrella bauzanensis]|uniref:Purine nucleoside phosphorylase n=1 Tax=Tistrella bauzanensis TaxID=657419 RepID=A0ABQ1I9Z5_9PROT|nr:peptidoglycan editing factor PgeF [Tistrella bauzanensis]GGB31232.1 laccase domain protein [Tistrella bauzanensis]
MTAPNPPPHDRHPLLDLPGIAHGFFGRRGGVSAGIHASLNCGPGSDDEAMAVATNRARVATALTAGGAAPLITNHQVHGQAVVTVDGHGFTLYPEAGHGATSRPQADGMIATRPGVVLGALAADCAPVLFADPEARVIGAAHAGWKGAVGGVTDAVIAAMEAAGARRALIRAVIGPCIAAASYEVGPELRAAAIAADPAAAGFFTPGRADRLQFDLPGYLLDRLRQSGITAASLGIDTYVNEATLFSYRRTTHRGEPDYGRQVSAITLLA